MDEATIAEIKRLDQENSRQNRRLEILEESVKETQKIAVSVQKLADNMERMLLEQQDQGKRLKDLEDKPAQTWSAMKKTIFNTLLGAVCGGAVALIGALLLFGIKNLM